jgi:hypothetical protein
VQGKNVLAVQVHNSDANSSDLTIRPFLSFGFTDAKTYFYDTPSWFQEPLVFASSNLPIIVIETHGRYITDEPEIIADMGIIDNGPGVRNNLSDPSNNYNGKIEIEFRGESSQMFPKKSFKVKTVIAANVDTTVSLLGMPKEDDWVLYAPYTDKTMMRNTLSYMLGNKTGHYATRTKYCELVINGEYQGVYVLMEKIKRDDNRVDISKLSGNATQGDNLTGGYILRVDKIDFNDYPAWISAPEPRLPNENNISFQFFDPDGEDLTASEKNYIKDYIFDFQSSLTNSNFKDQQAGYKKFIDMNSFVDFMLINELNKNIDAYVYSTYMHKDKDSKGGKLKMGPIWDFNLAFGNVDYNTNSQFAPGWMYHENYRMFWFRRLMQDPEFSDKFSCRWNELKQTIFNTSYINQWIDSTASVLEESQKRNYNRWPILGTYVWPNQFVGDTYASEIVFLKNWIAERIKWMEDNLDNNTCDEPVTGVEDELLKDVEVFPNPSKRGFHFNCKGRLNVRLSIYSSTGGLVFTSQADDQNFYWDGETNAGTPLPAGLYYYDVTGSNFSSKGKIVKQ